MISKTTADYRDDMNLFVAEIAHRVTGVPRNPEEAVKLGKASAGP